MSNAAPVIVIAPDSLKGSCSSPEAAQALARGVRSALGDTVEVREIPLADGGEGSLEALVSAWGGRIADVPTTDALGRAQTGRVGFATQGEAEPGASRAAIIETADANGLPLVSDQPLQALDADSAGVGSLIQAALDAEATELLLCLGGSATNDGGAGMLRALGAQLLDGAGQPIAPGARGLRNLALIDLSNLDPRARAARWRIACDVDNPLVGERGAAAVFGPQKGATPGDVADIDDGLTNFSEVLATTVGIEPSSLRSRVGLGAAGGLALGLVALFDAELLPGAQLVSEAVGLAEALHGADLVITGEGQFDTQSLDGKVVSQVLAEAEPSTAVMVIAGSVGLTAAQTREAGVTAALSIAPGPAALETLQADSLRLLTEAAAQACALFAAGRQSSR